MIKHKEVAEANHDLYRTKSSTRGKVLHMTLPIPPSVNSIYYNTRGGGRRLTSKAQNYVRDSRALMRAFVEDQRWIVPEKHTWLYLDMVFYFPDRRTRDSHNTTKILLDSMQDVLFVNDMYVLPRIWSVEYDKVNPRLDCVLSYQRDMDRAKGLKLTQIMVY